jgi:hypothetical protein
MDDVTGAWADSLDKGAGWDALDGPITSMNAQGVTGNQLPNTSEIGGRSGEGRTGKSAGEFVQKDAVGKGGRRTPTRLTEDPYQKGQVEDASKASPGGATGGGKISGAGAEGLEGPLPGELAEQLQAFAEKQAVIVNNAERIQANLTPGDYANFRMLEAVTLMNRVKSDLEHYRYRNLLRNRQAVLSALQETQDILSGRVEVVRDTSAQLPKYVRDDINDAMDTDLPDEYGEQLRQYYRRLSEQNGESR